MPMKLSYHTTELVPTFLYCRKSDKLSYSAFQDQRRLVQVSGFGADYWSTNPSRLAAILVNLSLVTHSS